jgi:hypothetical protein
LRCNTFGAPPHQAGAWCGERRTQVPRHLWISDQYKESERRAEAKRIYRLIEKYEEWRSFIEIGELTV